MTNKKFKQLRTGVYQLQPVINFHDRIIGVVINRTHYSSGGRRSDPMRLSKRQLEYFEHLDSFDRDADIEGTLDL